MDYELKQVVSLYPRGGTEAWIPDCILKSVLQRHGAGNVDLIVDCRVFKEPGRRELRSHIGQHPEILSGIFAGWNFHGWLKVFGYSLRKTLEGSDEVSVAFYCKSGKHRSVAASFFCKHIVESEGWTCAHLQHLSSANGWSNCCKGTCDECKAGAEAVIQVRREEVLTQLQRLWQSQKSG